MSTPDDFLFRGDLGTIDPAVAQLIEFESERQARKLIMIPSESSSPFAVREALGSSLINIYAEGYPNPGTRWLSEEEILDYEHHLALYRRYGDRRYYRGVEYADVVEALARRRCAEAFATDRLSADQIFVNVQPLSGAPANIAVEQALIRPGDTIMGLQLSDGGHLTHGSPANLSGQLFHTVPYHVNQETELLDYDAIEALAVENQPKLIIGGYTSYPRWPDWARLREIADRVGAYLMADIAHVAGMVIADAYPSPVGYADVITFTTHKTLCGPRGACILTADPVLARKIDRAVFPGLQGGPHVNKFAAIAVALKLARTKQFRQLQHQIVANAKALATALTNRGLRVPCGGTDTHLLLLDCTSVKGRDGTPLMGDTTAAILDILGIVVNKNTIPGDRSAVYPSGIRLGTPWVTQRGLREPEMEQIADIIARAFSAIEPLKYAGLHGPIFRAKVDFDVLERLRLEVAHMADRAGIDFEVKCSPYPHNCILPELQDRESVYTLIEIEGNKAAAFLEQVVAGNVSELHLDKWLPVAMLERDGALMGRCLLRRSGSAHNCFHLVVQSNRARRILAWLRQLSDGFVRFDDRDPWAKIPGPIVARDLGSFEGRPAELEALQDTHFTPTISKKPYFIGLHSEHYPDPIGEPLPEFKWTEPEADPRRTPLSNWHKTHGARMAAFAGWEMPLWYTSIHREHQAVRDAAGLFDISHMGVLEAAGPHAAYFLNLVTTNDAGALGPGQSQYSYLLGPDGHVMDDIMIYRITPARYIIIVNAANTARDWDWLQAVNNGAVRIDNARPWAQSSFRCKLRDLHSPDESYAWLASLALQGPRSREILVAMLNEAPPSPAVSDLRTRLMTINRTQIMEARIPSRRAPGGVYDLLLARTGYTGEPMGFELLVHPDVMEVLWEELLELGEPFGLRPIGLGARDSLRIEAGLPLYGHELAGTLDLRPDAIGFASYVKLHKAFFVGRQAYIEHAKQNKMTLIRFSVEGKGRGIPRPGDIVADAHGRVVGQVTSRAEGTDGYLTGLAYVSQQQSKPGKLLHIVPRPVRETWGKDYDSITVGDRLVVPVRAKVVRRFLKKE